MNAMSDLEVISISDLSILVHTSDFRQQGGKDLLEGENRRYTVCAFRLQIINIKR